MSQRANTRGFHDTFSFMFDPNSCAFCKASVGISFPVDSTNWTINLFALTTSRSALAFMFDRYSGTFGEAGVGICFSIDSTNWLIN